MPPGAKQAAAGGKLSGEGAAGLGGCSPRGGAHSHGADPLGGEGELGRGRHMK